MAAGGGKASNAAAASGRPRGRPLRKLPRATVTAELARMARYGVVGLAATACHLGVAEGLLLFAHVSPYIANILGFCCGFTVSFFGHHLFTFRNGGARISHALPRFLLIALTGLAINNFVLATLVHTRLVPDAVALVAAVAVVPLVSYVFARTWAFRHR